MLWIFTAIAGVTALAVTLGQLSVSIALLKFAPLLAAVGVTMVMGITLVLRPTK